MTRLNIPTPRWAVRFLEPMRYKGLKGGRASGKSHFFAELAVEAMISKPTTDIVCLREVQKSLRFSAKKLIEEKIEAFEASRMFRVLETEVRRLGPDGEVTGRIIFQGMQDHTADSIKSLEGFNIAWFEEASCMSQRSLDLLRPTIREPDSEIWFSWNPDQPSDPIEEFLAADTPENAIVAHINFEMNPFCPEVIKEEARIWYKNNTDSYAHVWGGAHNTKSDDQVLGGKWLVDEFEVDSAWDGPYYGADWGFSTDPNTVVEVYVDESGNRLYVRQEIWGLHVEIKDTPDFFDRMEGVCRHRVNRALISRVPIRADNARPEMISHVKSEGFLGIIAAEKWPGSIEDGISKIRSFEAVVIHPECPHAAEEARLYKHKRDRLTDDILPAIIDAHNHIWDAVRYAIEPITKQTRKSFWSNL